MFDQSFEIDFSVVTTGVEWHPGRGRRRRTSAAWTGAASGHRVPTSPVTTDRRWAAAGAGPSRRTLRDLLRDRRARGGPSRPFETVRDGRRATSSGHAAARPPQGTLL